MQPVSFTGTYKFTFTPTQQGDGDRIQNVINSCEQENIPHKEEYKNKGGNYPYSMPVYYIEGTIISPDEKDKMVESFLAQNGFNFERLDLKEINTPENIAARAAKAPDGFIKVKIDAQKLIELTKSQPQGNLDHVKHDYEHYFKDNLMQIIDGGDDYQAPALYLRPYGKVDDTIEYINRYGADRLNENSMLIDLDNADASKSSSNAPSYAMFYALLDKGLTKMPVYMNKDTYNLARALDLITY